MRAVGYVRVSDVSQIEGHSLDAQERLFKELCKNRGWEPVRIYREEGKSAHVDSIARRPEFRKLLDDAAKREFDIVVVHTLDRWSRNLQITLESLNILGKYNVGLVSITENLDWSTPEGRLTAHMLGMLGQYYSESLGKHVSKGLDQRAFEGKHTGGIPFGYESCWANGEKGEKYCRCNPEHPGGIHIHEKEGKAVTELFCRYMTGTTTLGQLATWLNEQGFRTRNIHRLPDANGILSAGPRLFTTASVRGILHNPFYTGKISYHGKLHPGKHDVLVGQDIFETVQITLKKNSGRSETLQARPERQYLLKGIVRCAYCGMPMWAQTYKNGQKYYREHKNSRSQEVCPSTSGSIPCHLIDNQIRQLVGTIKLRTRWLEEVLSIISLKDEVNRVKERKLAVLETLRRTGKTYVDGIISDMEYQRQKKLLNMELESLVVPAANSAENAGNLIKNLGKLWKDANLEEQRKLLMTMLDAVYVDARKTKSIVAIRVKPPFKPIFQVAIKKQNSEIHIINEPLKGTSVFPVETGES